MNISTTEDLYKHLRSHYTYDPVKGHLLRTKKTNNNQRLGVPIGMLRGDGYVNVSLGSKSYLEHRLIWLYTYGYMPVELDHINRVTNDNRLENLREVSRSTNMHNTRARVRELPPGVHKHHNKYRAIIANKHKIFHLGLFSTIEEASKAYNEKKHSFLHAYFDV